MNQDSTVQLLRRYEPVLRFTRGEHFFPMDVGPYIENSSLWVRPPDGKATCLVAQDRMSFDELVRTRNAEYGSVYFLRSAFPLSAKELATYKLQEHRRVRQTRDEFRAGTGRLARVGYTSRIIDAIFNVTLLTRGRVPGDLSSAAILNYRRIMANGERYRYFGRVVEENGWIVLQYWFFYFFNDWRSTFHGANDHEADWEMVNVYLDPRGGAEARPRWVAYAAHDYAGDDMRRRWDDPELEKIGEHPVVYVGAGSHAGYYQAGEYLTEFEFDFLKPLSRVTEQIRKVWHQKLRQYGGQSTEAEGDERHNIFHVPFVDYARGDGHSIGPEQELGWDEPLILTPPPAWVSQYRGLWGYYSADPLASENAPSGPMYNRDGSVRRAWFDPTGWCGLDKVPPPSAVLGVIAERRSELERSQAARRQGVVDKSQQLTRLEVELRSMRELPHLETASEESQTQVEALAEEVTRLRAQIAADEARLEALAMHAERLEGGDFGTPRDHIRRALRPASPAQLRAGRLAEFWAAISIGVMLIAFVALLEWGKSHLVSGLTAMVSTYVFIEASFRGQLTSLVTFVTITLALVATGVIVFEFWSQIMILAVVATGCYMLWENLRELWT